MNASYLPMHAMYNTGKQQAQSFLSYQQQCWLLQQPCDSGYAESDDDLFAQAFTSNEPRLKTIDEWVMESSSTPELSNPSSASSPFEYADSLVLPSKHWQPYETSYSTTYCLDGPAAYNAPHYHSHTSSMNSNATISQTQPSMQHTYQPPKDLAQVPMLQPSLMEDTSSVVDSSDAVSRPRQREHHTAVEQRYRKNLNEQFNNLRSAVPEIQTSQPQRAGQPAKPSKCEVLAGAVDYIRRLEEENQRLRSLADEGLDAGRKRARTMM